jgi:molybdenum cofactor synthesis domain-containing protein
VIISVSSTRTLDSDKSGKWIVKRAKKEGHTILTRKVLPDDREIIAQSVIDEIESQQPHAILLTGGTGIAKKDVTIEAVRPMFSKELTAFGALFAQLSLRKSIQPHSCLVPQPVLWVRPYCFVFREVSKPVNWPVKHSFSRKWGIL